MGYVATKKRQGQLKYYLLYILLAIIFGIIIALFDGLFALILFAPIVAILFILRDYRIGVVILVIILPFQHTPFLPSFTGFNIVNYLTTASLISMLLSKTKEFNYAPFPRFFWWAYLMPIGFAAIHGLMYLHEVPQNRIDLIGTVYTSPKTYLGGLVIKPLFIILISWMLGTAAINSKKPVLFLCPLFFAAVLAASAIMFFVIINGFDLKLLASARSRALLSGLGMHANEFGFLLGTSFILILFTYPAIQTSLARILTLFSLLAVGVALMLTFSRGGYVIAVVGVIGFIFIKKQIRYLFLMLFVMACIIAIAPEAVFERITTGSEDASMQSGGVTDQQDQLTAGRVWIWTQLLPEFLDSPIWGSGVGSTAWSTMVKNGLYINHPHNLYLRILLDMGVLGMLLMFKFGNLILGELKRIASSTTTPAVFASLAQGSFIAMIGVLVAGWSNGNYISESEFSLLWLSIGLALPYMRNPEKIKKSLARIH